MQLWQTWLSFLNTQETNPMLQMASVYGVQQTAKHAPAFFLPRVAEVSYCCSCVGLLKGQHNESTWKDFAEHDGRFSNAKCPLRVLFLPHLTSLLPSCGVVWSQRPCSVARLRFYPHSIVHPSILCPCYIGRATPGWPCQTSRCKGRG